MGKGPSELQREIAEQRRIIDRRIEGLEDRLSDDLSSLREGISEGVGSMFGLEDQVRAHPLMSVVSALGAGVVLGMASEGLPGDRRGRGRDHDAGLLAGLFSAAGGTFRDEVTEYVRYVAAGFARQHDHQEDDRYLARRDDRGEAPAGRRRGNGLGSHGDDRRA